MKVKTMPATTKQKELALFCSCLTLSCVVGGIVLFLSRDHAVESERQMLDAVIVDQNKLTDLHLGNFDRLQQAVRDNNPEKINEIRDQIKIEQQGIMQAKNIALQYILSARTQKSSQAFFQSVLFASAIFILVAMILFSLTAGQKLFEWKKLCFIMILSLLFAVQTQVLAYRKFFSSLMITEGFKCQLEYNEAKYGFIIDSIKIKEHQ